MTVAWACILAQHLSSATQLYNNFLPISSAKKIGMRLQFERSDSHKTQKMRKGNRLFGKVWTDNGGSIPLFSEFRHISRMTGGMLLWQRIKETVVVVAFSHKNERERGIKIIAFFPLPTMLLLCATHGKNANITHTCSGRTWQRNFFNVRKRENKVAKSGCPYKLSKRFVELRQKCLTTKLVVGIQDCQGIDSPKNCFCHFP